MIEYAKRLTAEHVAFRREIRDAVQKFPLEPADRVLDVPCGDGFYATLLAERLNRSGCVVAADCNDEMLAAARHRDQQQADRGTIEEVYADAYRLPFDDGDFDFVWCAQSLISLSQPDEQTPGEGTRRAVAEMHRVLKPGGWIGLMEHDALHHVLLPWPTELEVAIHQAYRAGFAACCGRPQQLDPGRRLGMLLAEMGFESIRRHTIAADRYGAMEGELRIFLDEYFAQLRRRIAEFVGADVLEPFDRLTDADGDESFFSDPHFEMTWLSFVTLGRKRQR